MMLEELNETLKLLHNMWTDVKNDNVNGKVDNEAMRVVAMYTDTMIHRVNSMANLVGRLEENKEGVITNA
jgi:hypothetical protein